MYKVNISQELDFGTIQIDMLKHIKKEIDPVLPGNYKITSLIGNGAIGSVYTAFDRDSKGFLAVKIVQTMINEKKRKRIREECAIQKALRHTNIAEVYGVTSTESFIAIFMELVTGGDLFDLIPIERGINIGRGFRIYRQLLDAVDYCHSRHIVHLDIKPENIMISNSGTPKLIDFGLAVDHKVKPFIIGHVGTLAYSAPETFLDREYMGYKADLFSLNVTFLTLVTGERCWTQATLNDFHYLDWYEKKWSMKMPQRLPPDLLSFLIGALAFDPTERFSIEQIKAHIWYRQGLQNNIKAIKTHKTSSTDNFFPKSQPTVMKDILNTSLRADDIDVDIPLSQPLDLSELLMPESRNDQQMVSIVKRMTRFFSNMSLEGTLSQVAMVIEQHQQCTIIQKSLNHIMVSSSDLTGIEVVFRIFVYKFGESILVDFRRVRGDGLLFRTLYMDIFHTAMQLELVNDNHPYLSKVQPRVRNRSEETVTTD